MNKGKRECGNQTCPVCKLRQRIVGEGAELQQGSVISEEGCKCDIRFDQKCKCVCLIRLDVPNASYRRKSDSGNMTKMCDFAVATVTGRQLHLVVIELKSGTEGREAIEQLQAGLVLLHNNISRKEVVCPSAYIVTQKSTQYLKRLLSKRSSRLKLGSKSYIPQVIKCGEKLSIPQGR